MSDHERGGYLARPGNERSRDHQRDWSGGSRSRAASAEHEPTYQPASAETRALTRKLRSAVADATTHLAELEAALQRGPAPAELEASLSAAFEQADRALAALDRETVPSGCLDGVQIRDATAKLAQLREAQLGLVARPIRQVGAAEGGVEHDARLPTGAPFALMPGEDTAAVRRTWITDSHHPQADRIRTDRMLEVLVATRSAGRFAWATDADLDSAACARTRLPPDQLGPIVTLELGILLSHHAGLPAGERARIARRGDGLELVFALRGASRDGEWVAIDADAGQALASGLEEALGYPPDPAALARLVRADHRVLVRHGAAHLVLSRAECGDLLGNADPSAGARGWLSANLALSFDLGDVDRDLVRIINEIDRHPYRAAILRHARTSIAGAAITPALLETLAYDAVEAELAARELKSREASWSTEAAPMAAGLGLGAVGVRSDAIARGITEATGASGVALDGVVHLHPERLQPGTSEGRGVLAHELIHLAQARLGAEDDREAAEDEAADLAPMLVSGSSVRPRLAIDLGSPAADTHAKRHRKPKAKSVAPDGPTSSSLASLTPSKHKLKLPRTVVGEHATPRTVQIYNRGETDAELGDLRAMDAHSDRIFPVYAPALEPIPPGGFVEIQIGFRPENTQIVTGDYQILDGDGALAGTIHLVGQGETLEHAAGRAVHQGGDVRVATYAELEAALQASVKLAESDDAAKRAEATKLAEAVVNRLDAIENNVHLAAGDYGVASTTMIMSWGCGTTAVRTWWRGLRADNRPRDGAVMLTSFGAIREIVQIGTKELDHSNALQALDSPGVTITATALPALAAVAAPAVIEAAPELLPWALNNPNTALAVVDVAANLAPQVVEAGGLVNYVEAVAHDPSRLLDLAMGILQLRQARGADVELGGGEERARQPGSMPDESVDTAVKTTTVAKPPANAAVDVADHQVAKTITEDTPQRVPQQGDPANEYRYDQMRPGPLSDRERWDPKGTGAVLPAQGFYGGKYDEMVLPEDTILYRVGNAEREWGEWFTDKPLQSEAQYRIDVAVKREWTDPATGTMQAGSARSQQQLELWCYSIRIPKGTTVYRGPVGSQGDVFMGGLSQTQYFIPKAWTLESTGGKVVAKAPFVRDGHVQPEPQEQDQ